jgi:seryl-tRNA synthetase
VERLTHDSYIVQVSRITGRFQTKLDKLLSIFEQANFVDDKQIIKEFKFDTDVEEIKLMTDILHYTGTDPVEKKAIEHEEEAWRTIDVALNSTRKKYHNAVKEINEMSEKIIEMRETEANAKKEMDETKKEMDEKDKLIKELLKKLGESES